MSQAVLTTQVKKFSTKTRNISLKFNLNSDKKSSQQKFINTLLWRYVKTSFD